MSRLKNKIDEFLSREHEHRGTIIVVKCTKQDWQELADDIEFSGTMSARMMDEYDPTLYQTILYRGYRIVIDAKDTVKRMSIKWR